MPSSYVSSLMLSDTVGARDRVTDEDAIIKVIEVKKDSDGVNVSYTGETISLERAFQCGLVVASDYAKALERQKTLQDEAEDVSMFESVQEIEPCEVNSLISKCLSRNKSPISQRDAHALRLSSPQLDVSDLDKCQGMEDVNVEAEVQCDLMSSSSTLIMLGSQHQYLGLVLPPYEENQMISNSSGDEKTSTTTGFTSSLFSKKEKIAAFYIPQFSEVVDFDVAVEKGLIDSFTADVLKTIEIPDAVPNVDGLNEKFSSWLMYMKLTVDGCFHAAECLKVDSFPSPAEAEQMFVSYLMINSYIDTQTGKRVVILDRELSKMVKIFLGDPASSGGDDRYAASLHLNVSSISEQSNGNLKLHINEEEDSDMEDNRDTCEPPYFTSLVNGRASFGGEAYPGDRAVKHCSVLDVAEENDINVDENLHAAEKTAGLKNTDWSRSDEFGQVIYGSDSQADDTDADGTSSSQTPLDNTESICSEPDITDTFKAVFLHPDDLLDDEQDFVIEVLEAHVEEKDISDMPSVRRFGINAAHSENLMDKEAFVKLLHSHSDDTESTEGDEWMSEFKENVSGGYNSSYCSYFLSEKQTISRSGCTISISESFQAGVSNDEFLDSDPETNVYSQEDCAPSASRSNALAVMDANGPGKQPTVGKVAGSEAVEGTEIGREITDREVDCETPGNAEEMSRYLDGCLPAVDDRGSQIFPRSPWSQVTAECAHRTSKSSLPPDHHDSQGVGGRKLTGAADEGENTPKSDERGNSESQYATLPAHPDSDGPLFVRKVLIMESDSEVEAQEVNESESDALSHVPSHEGYTAEAETSGLRPHTRAESAPSGRYSHTRVENDFVCDSSKVRSPQPSEADSERGACVEREPGQEVPESAISPDEVIVADQFESISEGDSEREESHTPARKITGSQYGPVGGELSTGFSPERQLGDTFRADDGEEVCFLKPLEMSDGDVAIVELGSDQAETAVRVEARSDAPVENSTPEEASEDVTLCQTIQTDVPSDGRITSDPSEASSGVKMGSDQLSDVGNFQSAEDVEGPHSIHPNTSQLVENDKKDSSHALLESRHPDLLVDLLKRNARNLESKEGGEPQQADEFPSVQQQLLQVLKAVTSTQDLSMLQEVMQSLNMALGSNTQEVQRHLLDSIKEESSDGEDEDDSPQSSASSDGCKVEKAEEKVQVC